MAKLTNTTPLLNSLNSLANENLNNTFSNNGIDISTASGFEQTINSKLTVDTSEAVDSIQLVVNMLNEIKRNDALNQYSESMGVAVNKMVNDILSGSKTLSEAVSGVIRDTNENMSDMAKNNAVISQSLSKLQDTLNKFGDSVRDVFKDASRSADDFQRKLHELSQKDYNVNFDVKADVEGAKNAIKGMQEEVQKALAGIADKNQFGEFEQNFTNSINTVLSKFKDQSADISKLSSLMSSNVLVENYVINAEAQLKELKEQFANADGVDKDRLQREIDDLQKTITNSISKTLENTTKKINEQLTQLTQGKIDGLIDFNAINTQRLNSNMTSSMQNMAYSANTLFSSAAAHGTNTSQMVADLQRFNTSNNEMRQLMQNLTDAMNSDNKEDVVRQLTKGGTLNATLQGTKISQQTLDLANSDNNRIYTAAQKEQIQAAQSEVKARKEMVQSMLGMMTILSTFVDNKELRDAIAELRKEFDELEKTTEKMNHKQGNAVDKVNNFFTQSQGTQDFDKSVNGLLNTFQTNSVGLDKIVSNFANGVDRFVTGVEKLLKDLPSGNTAAWLQQIGASQDMANFANSIMDSTIGSFLTDNIDKVMGTNLSGVQFSESDMNGRVMQAALDPESLWKMIGVTGISQQELEANAIKFAKEEEDIVFNGIKTATQRGFSESGASISNFVLGEGRTLWQLSGGKIGIGELGKSYDTFSKAGARNSNDAKLFSEYALLAQETKGLDQSTVLSMMQTYYVDLGKSVNETVAAMEKMNKLSLTSGIPMNELCKALANVAERYRQIGMDADLAEGTLTNLINMGFSLKDAQEIATATGGALQNFSNKTGDVIMGGILGGQTDPFSMLFQSQHVTGEGWAQQMAGSLDNMLGMTRSMFGNSDLGNYQILKQLQGYGYSQKQASQIFDKMQSGDIDGVSDILSTMKTADEIAEDTNSVINDMKGTLGNIGANIGVIHQQQQKADEAAESQVGRIEGFAKELNTKLNQILNKNINAMAFDYDAMAEALKDKNSLLNEAIENPEQFDILKGLGDFAKNFFTNPAVLTSLALFGAIAGNVTVIMGKMLGLSLNSLSSIFSKDGGFLGFGGANGKTVEGLSGYLGGQTSAAALAGQAVLGAGIGFGVSKAGDVIQSGLESAGWIDQDTVEFLDMNETGRTVATTLAGALGGYLGGPGGAIIASAIAEAAGGVIAKVFGDMAAKFDVESEYKKETDIKDDTFDTELVWNKYGSILQKLGLTKDNAFITQENGRTAFENVMLSKQSLDIGFMGLDAGKSRYTTLTGQTIKFNQQETAELQALMEDFQATQHNQLMAGKNKEDIANDIQNSTQQVRLSDEYVKTMLYKAYGYEVNLDKLSLDYSNGKPQIKTGNATHADSQIFDAGYSAEDLQQLRKYIVAKNPTSLNDYYKNYNFSNEGKSLLSNLGLGKNYANGNFELDTEAFKNLNDTERNQIQALLDNGSLLNTATTEQKNNIKETTNLIKTNNDLNTTSQKLETAMKNLAQKDFNVNVNVGVPNTFSSSSSLDNTSSAGNTDKEKQFMDLTSGKNVAGIYEALGITSKDAFDVKAISSVNLHEKVKSGSGISEEVKKEIEDFLSTNKTMNALSDEARMIVAQYTDADGVKNVLYNDKGERIALSGEALETAKNEIFSNSYNSRQTSITDVIDDTLKSYGIGQTGRVTNLAYDKMETKDYKEYKATNLEFIKSGKNGEEDVYTYWMTNAEGKKIGNERTANRTDLQKIISGYYKEDTNIDKLVDLTTKLVDKTTENGNTGAQVEANTGKGADAAQDAADAAKSVYQTLTGSSSSNQRYLGNGQLITTGMALHNSSYLNGNSSSSVNWDTYYKAMEEVGGGIGTAKNSMGLSMGLASKMDLSGTGRYKSGIQTINDTYTQRGGYNANINVHFSSVDRVLQDTVVNSVYDGIDKSGATATITTNNAVYANPS